MDAVGCEKYRLVSVPPRPQGAHGRRKAHDLHVTSCIPSDTTEVTRAQIVIPVLETRKSRLRVAKCHITDKFPRRNLYPSNYTSDPFDVQEELTDDGGQGFLWRMESRPATPSRDSGSERSTSHILQGFPWADIGLCCMWQVYQGHT